MSSCNTGERMSKDEPQLMSRGAIERRTTDDGDHDQKHSLRSFLMNSEISDHEDDKRSFRKKPAYPDKEATNPENVDCSEKCHETVSGSSVEVLLRIFPQHNPSILEMILKAYDNDLVRATESLMLENGMLRFPTPPISPEESTPPPVIIDPEETPNDPRRSAFSPVSTKIIPYSPHMLPVSLPSTTIPPYAPPGFATRSIFPPYMIPRHHHMGLPFHPYMRRHPGGATVHSSSTHHDSKLCSRCSNWILATDRFCSLCGKSA